MDKARIFPNGGRQAVRLPKAYQFDCKEVFINKVNGIVMLIPEGHGWESLVQSLDQFSDDFMADRAEPAEPQTRESL